MGKLNKLIILIVGCLAFLIPHTALRAQTFPKVYVYGENDDADNISCSASHKSAVAAVQAALRGNNIEIEYSDSANSNIKAYVNIVVVKPSNICSAFFSLKLQHYQYIEYDYNKKVFFATVLHCDKGSIVTGSASHVYSSILLGMKDMTNECISTYYENMKE
jgi:hypothetical protein